MAEPGPTDAAIDPSSDERDGLRLVSVDALRASDAVSSCLRPLGLCELGGACDACWYSPDHPRFKGAVKP